jgi:hypothetical protein
LPVCVERRDAHAGQVYQEGERVGVGMSRRGRWERKKKKKKRRRRKRR